MIPHTSEAAARFLAPLAGLVQREPPAAARRSDARDDFADFGYALQLQPAALSQFSSWLTLVSQGLAGADQGLWQQDADELYIWVRAVACPFCVCACRAPVARY